MENKIERMQKLIRDLEAASYAYYTQDNPTVSDKTWDAWFDELAKLEAETGVVLSGSPTQKVSGQLDASLAEVRHESPMLSAAKTKSAEELKGFAAKAPGPNQKLSASWKEDGLTVVLTYEDGLFQQGVTRGDGEIGEDVTENIMRVYRNVPRRIPQKGRVRVRGEGLISYQMFKELNERTYDAYELERACSGSLTRHPKETAGCILDFKAFELVEPRTPTKHEQWEMLEEMGFECAEHEIISPEEIDDVIERFDPAHYDYPVDGIIFEYDDSVFGRSLGATGHHERNKMAFKWQDEAKKTVFRGAVFRPTRTGRISMTAVFDPVSIENTTVQRATLHNLTFFRGLALGTGDEIEVYKANKIIPAIDRNLTRSGTFTLPATCPCCGSALVEEDDYLRCKNPDCSAKQLRKFEHFVARRAMDIDGLSSASLEELLENGCVKSFDDLFRLSEHPEIASWDGWGKRSYENMLASAEAARHTTLSKLLTGLGIPEVGRSASRALSKYFHGSEPAFRQALDSGFDFTQLDDFGDIMSNNLKLFFANAENRAAWEKLCAVVEFAEEFSGPASASAENPFAGKTIVATGSLKNFTRDSINAKIESLGAKAGSSVSKKTDFVLAGENAGSKRTKAQTLGVRIISEDEFMSMIGEA